MKPGLNQPCPCGHGAKFKRCCRPFHRGTPAPDPESLMRSRYTAYATGEVEYILATTHPDGPHYESDLTRWASEVRAFCDSTAFEGLSVLGSGVEAETGWVSFRASLSQGGRDASFTERSTFRRVDGRWLYYSGRSD